MDPILADPGTFSLAFINPIGNDFLVKFLLILFVFFKSRIEETLNLSTNADNGTNIFFS